MIHEQTPDSSPETGPGSDAAIPEIRTPRPEDMAALAELLGELGYPATPHDVERRLRAMMGTMATVVLVATVAERVVGLATGHRHPSLHADGEIAQLTSLVVSSTVRGRGVGRRLVEAIEAWARAAGCPRVFVNTANHRAGAHAFYDRLGYDHTGRRYARNLEPR